MTLGPLMLDVEGHALSARERERLCNPLVGGVILFSRNYTGLEQLRALVAEIRALQTPPLLIAVDQEGGRIQRFREDFYALPSLRWLGHQYDLDPAHGRRLAWQCGWLMAAEVLDSGVDFSFSPVVDLDFGLSEVIGDRSFHRDPEIVATLAVAWLQGMHKAGMIGVAKHFPGHGHVVADSHLELPVDHRTLAELYDDLLPYERLLSHGLNAVMVAHVRYPRVDAEVASLSPYWLGTALRRDLGMRGAIFTDDLSMRALASEGEIPERARRALTAGADMALVCNDPAGAEATLDALQGYTDPAGQSRLAALRRKVSAPLPGAGLRGSADWRQAVASLDKALARPGLALG
jgi:beta-N-acetylhexosaminidase